MTRRRLAVRCAGPRTGPLCEPAGLVVNHRLPSPGEPAIPFDRPAGVYASCKAGRVATSGGSARTLPQPRTPVDAVVVLTRPNPSGRARFLSVNGAEVACADPRLWT